MTTDTAQIRSDATETPLGADAIDHDAAYDALRRLHRACWRIRNGVVASLRSDVAQEFHEALQEAHDLLFPPPLPDAPDGAEVIYARAVRVGDSMWMGPDLRFRQVGEIATGSAGTTPVLNFELRYTKCDDWPWFRPDDIVVVRRAEGQGA